MDETKDTATINNRQMYYAHCVSAQCYVLYNGFIELLERTFNLKSFYMLSTMSRKQPRDSKLSILVSTQLAETRNFTFVLYLCYMIDYLPLIRLLTNTFVACLDH